MNLEKELRYMEYVQREAGTRHQSVEEDQLIFELLKAGDMRAVEMMQQMVNSNLPGVTSSDPLRNAKYLFVAAVTMAGFVSGIMILAQI